MVRTPRLETVICGKALGEATGMAVLTVLFAGNGSFWRALAVAVVL